MVVARECIRCGRKVRPLVDLAQAIRVAMATATRAAELEILRSVVADLTCHTEACERRRATA